MPELAINSPVLFFGRLLHVTGFRPGTAGRVADCRDLEGDRIRTEAREEILKLREMQAETENEDSERLANKAHAAFAAEIEELSKAASAAGFVMSLRCDLLSYWEQKAVWVSDGRILSDAQHERWTGSSKKRVPTAEQRGVLLALEAMDAKKAGK